MKDEDHHSCHSPCPPKNDSRFNAVKIFSNAILAEVHEASPSSLAAWRVMCLLIGLSRSSYCCNQGCLSSMGKASV